MVMTLKQILNEFKSAGYSVKYFRNFTDATSGKTTHDRDYTYAIIYDANGKSVFKIADEDAESVDMSIKLFFADLKEL